MKIKRKTETARRSPVQVRAHVTVQAMLDASIKLLKRGGSSSLTTNRIAETAGVSIGSVYQYFPNKRAIYVALHDRHIAQVDAILHRKMIESEEATLEELLEAMIDGMIEVHSGDPELSELLQSEVPHRAEGTVDFSVRNHAAIRKAIEPHVSAFGRRADLDMRAFVVSNMLDSLGHAIVLRRPAGISLRRAKVEVLRAILVYLRDTALTVK